MQRILHQTHNKHTFIYASSRLFERASYYGLRSLIVFYLIGETIKMSAQEAMSVYGWFTGLIIFSQILGALFGDLIIGNKKSIIIGGILQAIGAFSLCIPLTTGIYVSLFFIIMGSGLYTPNMLSYFGKLYLSKSKLLDSGFTIIYLAANIGATLGVLIISYLGNTIGLKTGFIIAGILMLFSISFPVISKDSDNSQKIEENIPSKQRILIVITALVLVGFLWATYEISNIRILDLHLKFSENPNLNIPKSFWSSLNSVFIIPISIIAIILWSNFYNSQFTKLTIGFLLGAISFGLLLFIPEIPTNQHLILFLISMLFLSIAEIHIAPVIHSVLTQYTNPKYLGTIISLSFIPTKLVFVIVGFFNEGLNENPVLALTVGTIAMFVISTGLVFYTLYNKKLPKKVAN